MKILKFVLALTLLIATPPLLADGEEGDDDGISDRFDNRMAVRVAPGATLQDFIDAFADLHPTVVLTPADVISGRDIHLLDVVAPPEVIIDEIELELFEEDSTEYGELLEWGEFLYENSAPEGHTGSVFVDSIGDAFSFENQYAVGMLGLDVAHLESTGFGVVVAVLDTGIDASHPVLAGRIAPGGYNFIDDNGDVDEAAGGVMSGHGTFISGLIALTAPDAGILPIKVLDPDGRGDGWALAEGLFHAIDHGAHVINLSLGSTYDDDAVEDAIDEAIASGIVVVAAAGNLNRCEPEEFPAMKSDPIGVAAVDHLDVKAAFSNYHEKIDLCAPGTTALVNGDPDQPDPDLAIIGLVPGDGYAAWAGTSMATPFVSGGAALVRGRCDLWPESEATVFQIEGLLTAPSNVAPIYHLPGNAAYEDMLGSGRLDLAAVMSAPFVCPQVPCDADLDGNGEVGVIDLTQVVLAWGACGPICPADVDGSGVVDVDDLVAVILAWGPCP